MKYRFVLNELTHGPAFLKCLVLPLSSILIEGHSEVLRRNCSLDASSADCTFNARKSLNCSLAGGNWCQSVENALARAVYVSQNIHPMHHHVSLVCLGFSAQSDRTRPIGQGSGVVKADRGCFGRDICSGLPRTSARLIESKGVMCVIKGVEKSKIAWSKLREIRM